jgi:hypothetical protein
MSKNRRKINKANHGKRPSGGAQRRRNKGKTVRT